nr:NAD(P)H-hydrate dehydratase [Novosphingobium sp. B 225]
MPSRSNQILTVRQMRAGEEALIAAGTTVDHLMQVAGRGAAEWVWRVAGPGKVTVLCGPGNNGGDGYVIAEALRERGGTVQVIAACDPATPAARTARALYQGQILGPDAAVRGAVLVDCLFGSGLTRALTAEHAALLRRLAASHDKRIAVDLPSGIESDSGAPLTPDLPQWDLTIALGAWKSAHFLMPACAAMGALRLVEIGVEAIPGAAQVITRPVLNTPAADAHKYRRGLLGVIGGAMPGAALLAARAAQHGGAGYVKLLGAADWAPSDLVVDSGPLGAALQDRRWSALLVGPGLGRSKTAREQLETALDAQVPTVLDADALMLFGAVMAQGHQAGRVLTPHAGEFDVLERAFKLSGLGSKLDRAVELAAHTGAVVVAKGPDTVVTAPDGRVALARRASSWLSTAGTGDVLAGTIASRLATGADPFEAACQGVWLHSEAARLCPPAFTAGQLAEAVQCAYAACL